MKTLNYMLRYVLVVTVGLVMGTGVSAHAAGAQQKNRSAPIATAPWDTLTNQVYQWNPRAPLLQYLRKSNFFAVAILESPLPQQARGELFQSLFSPRTDLIRIQALVNAAFAKIDPKTLRSFAWAIVAEDGVKAKLTGAPREALAKLETPMVLWKMAELAEKQRATQKDGERGGTYGTHGGALLNSGAGDPYFRGMPAPGGGTSGTESAGGQGGVNPSTEGGSSASAEGGSGSSMDCIANLLAPKSMPQHGKGDSDPSPAPGTTPEPGGNVTTGSKGEVVGNAPNETQKFLYDNQCNFAVDPTKYYSSGGPGASQPPAFNQTAGVTTTWTNGNRTETTFQAKGELMNKKTGEVVGVWGSVTTERLYEDGEVIESVDHGEMVVKYSESSEETKGKMMEKASEYHSATKASYGESPALTKSKKEYQENHSEDGSDGGSDGGDGGSSYNPDGSGGVCVDQCLPVNTASNLPDDCVGKQLGQTSGIAMIDPAAAANCGGAAAVPMTLLMKLWDPSPLLETMKVIQKQGVIYQTPVDAEAANF